MYRRLYLILALLLTLGSVYARVKPLNFENPGNRRLLKDANSSYYYFRSLPEKSMTLNVDGISSIELRAFAIEPLRKPQIVSIIGKKRSVTDLVLKERLDGYYIYQNVSIAIPKGTKTMELLCYDRGIYFRAFHTVTPTPKPKASKPDNLVVRAHGGIINVAHNGTNNDYYVFNPSQSLKFTVNNERNAEVFVRARLLDRTLPVFELYANGSMLQTHEFTLKRSTKYKATGINHLTTGLKLELPATGTATEYELRAKSDHLFLARPIILKSK